MDKKGIQRLSYKDPDGFVVALHAGFYRVVFESFREDLALITASGILDRIPLVSHTLLSEQEWPQPLKEWFSFNRPVKKVLCVYRLETITPFVYPWEWTVSMLIDAAILTLEIQQLLVKEGLTLKDASFLNIQFINGRPFFVDLLSIKKAEQSYPWPAYGQYLRHFFAPLAIHRNTGVSVHKMLIAYPDGIDTQYAAAFLPLRSWFNIPELVNLHLNNILGKKVQPNTKEEKAKSSIENQPKKITALLDFNLQYLKSLQPKGKNSSKTEWTHYYEQDVASDYHNAKLGLVHSMLSQLPNLQSCLDLGANDGTYSALAIPFCQTIISVEQDPACCEKIFQKIVQTDTELNNWAVLCADLLAPSPATGWLNTEHRSFFERIHASVVFALALIHHLYFKGSIYFDEITRMFDVVSENYVITEFITAADKKVIQLSQFNQTRLEQYHLDNFKSALNEKFQILQETGISDTRTILLLKKIQQ